MRWIQGRLAELEEAADEMIEQYGPVWRCARVTLRAETGQAESARHELEELAEDDFADIGPGADGQVGAICLAAACTALRDERFAHVLYERLRSQAHLVASTAGAAICLGSVSSYLGELAALQGRFEEAATHFDHAIERNEAIGALPYVADAQCNYAAMLAARRDPRDREKALELLASARAIAERIGMGHVLAKVPQLESELGAGVRTASGT